MSFSLDIRSLCTNIEKSYIAIIVALHYISCSFNPTLLKPYPVMQPRSRSRDVPNASSRPRLGHRRPRSRPRLRLVPQRLGLGPKHLCPRLGLDSQCLGSRLGLIGLAHITAIEIANINFFACSHRLFDRISKPLHSRHIGTWRSILGCE